MRIQNEWGDFSEFNPFMDYNLGLWTNNLGYYIEEFKNNHERFIAMRWDTADISTAGYSVILNPCGSVVFELISDHIPQEYLPLFKTEYKTRYNIRLKHDFRRE